MEQRRLAGPITRKSLDSISSHATKFMLDKFRTDDVFGYETIRVSSQGSVASCEPSVHTFFMNEGFDQQFVSDLTLALKNLRDRINGSVA